MIASQAASRDTRQSIQKAAWDAIEEPVSMRLVGCDPESMGEAARLNQDRGAAIIDINFGCPVRRSEEHTSELQSLMRISYAVFCLKKKKKKRKILELTET